MEADASIGPMIAVGAVANVRRSILVGWTPRRSRVGYLRRPARPIGFPPKRNGNTPPAPERTPRTGGDATWAPVQRSAGRERPASRTGGLHAGAETAI